MITPEDIARAVSRNALQKGFDYFNQGRVLSLDVLMNGRLIESVIAGSGDNLYGQTIELRAQRGGPTVISGDCDCPVGQPRRASAARGTTGSGRARVAPA